MLAVKRSGAGRAAMTGFSMDTAVARYVAVLVGASAGVSR
jgi:hypothetical protein